MPHSLASTSVAANTPAGSSRKRVRKRTRKSKSSDSNVPAGADESSSDQEAPPAKVTLPNAGTTSTTLDAPNKSVAGSSSAKSSNAGLIAVNPHKPSFITRPAINGATNFTVSVAIPGSIVLNAQSPELQSRLAAHIARACAIFNVDEIVVFDEGELRGETSDPYQHKHNNRRHNFSRPPRRGNREQNQQANGSQENGEGERHAQKQGFDPHTFLARVLQYLETPQYLRKALFPIHSHLSLAGLMPPFHCPHHLSFEDQSEYQEAVTQHPPHWATNNPYNSTDKTVYVNVRLRHPIQALVPRGASLEAGVRVTIRMPINQYHKRHILSPREPVQKLGWYWGYTVRLASSLSSVLTACPFSSDASSYDLVIGTSERGVSLTDLALATTNKTPVLLPSGETVQPLPAKFNHALIVFGGLSGLELAVEADKGIKLDSHTPKVLFDACINLVENQASRSLRTQQPIIIALPTLNPIIEHVANPM